MTRTVICPLADLVEAEPRKVDVDGKPVAIVRIGDQVHAVGDTCTHANVSLSEGFVDVQSCTIECWKHGSAFSLITGEPQSFPATLPTQVYAAGVEAGDVWVEIR